MFLSKSQEFLKGTQDFFLLSSIKPKHFRAFQFSVLLLDLWECFLITLCLSSLVGPVVVSVSWGGGDDARKRFSSKTNSKPCTDVSYLYCLYHHHHHPIIIAIITMTTTISTTIITTITSIIASSPIHYQLSSQTSPWFRLFFKNI